MSIRIIAYANPYEIDQESFWSDIKVCPQFCVSQTMVNGMKKTYDTWDKLGRLSTIRNFINCLYSDWESDSVKVKQIVEVDATINRLFSGTENEKLRRSLSFNTRAIAKSIRLLCELDMDDDLGSLEKLNEDQKYLIKIYKEILKDKKSSFSFKRDINLEKINDAIKKALYGDGDTTNYDKLSSDTVVIHGIHQFSPVMLDVIGELAKYKNIILMFNYQPQYKKVYETWLRIYSLFGVKLEINSGEQFTPNPMLVPSYKSNILADDIGKIYDGNFDFSDDVDDLEIIEFRNLSEFSEYVADLYTEAQKKSKATTEERSTLSYMSEQLYSASGKVNDILRAYFPEQFEERHFLDYPIGRFFVAAANMWDPENRIVRVKDFSDICECFNAGILSEEKPGELVGSFKTITPFVEKETSLIRITDRLKNNLLKYLNKSDPEKIRDKVGYYNIGFDELDRLVCSLEELDDIVKKFFENADEYGYNFSSFYKRIKNFLINKLESDDSLDLEMKNVISRLLVRLNRSDIPQTGTYNSLKRTLDYYLNPEPRKGASWIVRGFEQIDGDVLLSSKQSADKVCYHFCCLSDKDILASKDESLPWPLDVSFFENAYIPEDWKYQVYLRSKKEYNNFNRYALVYGLEFNRVGVKISYVKSENEKENDIYNVVKLLGIKVKKYVPYNDSNHQEKLEYPVDSETPDSSSFNFDKLDEIRYKLCPYKFLLESVVQNKTVFRERFHIGVYARNLALEKAYKEIGGTSITKDELNNVLAQKFDEVNTKLRLFTEFEKNQNVSFMNNRISKNSKGKSITVKNHSNEYALDLLDIEIDKIEKDKTKLNYQEIMKNNSFPANPGEYCTYCSSKALCLYRGGKEK